MNKTFCKKSNLINFLLAGCLILFNIVFAGCGLDTFVELKEPSVNHEPIYSSIDVSENYFEFTTALNTYEGFLGTEVYYKIYNSTSKLTSEYSSINSAASSETTSNQSATRLIETYTYQPLRHKADEGANYLISDTNSAHRVKIRLSDYPEYPAEVSVDGTTYKVIEDGVEINSYPVRSILKNPSFKFKTLSSDYLPKSGDNGDPDYGYTSTTDEIKEYYVALFAVSVAQDETYARLYSKAVYLGSVTISLED